MKDKELKLFGAVFLVLLVLFFITKPRHQSVNLDEFVQTILIGIAEDDIKNIEVYKEASGEKVASMLFSKTDDQWRIPSYFNAKAQNSRIDRLVADLVEMTGKVRSEDPKHHEKYEITDEQGLHLLLKDETDKPLANLIIGKKSEDAGSGFIRFAGKDKVYFADKNLLSSLGITANIDTLTRFKPKSFVDLKAVDQDQSTLKRVYLVSNGVQRVIEKQEREVEVEEDSTTTTRMETVWMLIGSGSQMELDKQAVDDFLRDVTSLYASEVVDRIGGGGDVLNLSDLNKPAQYGVARPTSYLVFETEDGAQHNIVFGKEYEKDKGYFLHVQDEGLVYKVSKYNYDKVFKWVDDLPGKVKKES